MRLAAKHHLLRDRCELALAGWVEIEQVALEGDDPDAIELATLTGHLMTATLRRARDLDDEEVFVCEIDESAGLKEATS